MIVQVYGVLIMTFLVLIIAHHLILTIAKITFLILGEDPTYGINGSFGSTENKFSISFTQNFV